jgi:hypothetical protein
MIANSNAPHLYDVVVVGATPGGIMAAIAAAREGLSVVILERTSHVGGLPANGLGATDISTREAAGGLFKDFTDRIRETYRRTYGVDSEQYVMCSEGFHFEPSVAEKVLEEMLGEHPSIEVRRRRQFDARPDRVKRQGGRLVSLVVTNLSTGAEEIVRGRMFVDGTYEGDLAAAAGVPFNTRREGVLDYGEPLAGRVYRKWKSLEVGEGSTGEGDDTIQAYNFRLCLTDRPENAVPIQKPENYNRDDYASLIEDFRENRVPGLYTDEQEWDGIGRVTNIVWIPNGKTDANNQHLAFVSTDLPEENYPWPTADWAWRDAFLKRLRDYTLGLFWFIQNDPEVPESLRNNARRFGLAADEYQDNGNFPRQVYVREGRRILGQYCFLAHDALSSEPGGRPPIHPDSIGASHYPIDSHAVRKREPGRDHLDGFINMTTQPYTVPYGVIVPRTIENLWIPVPVSASHLGFGTLRMEPCWMLLGEAAGMAAALALELNVSARCVPIELLQRQLLDHGAVLIYYKNVSRDDPAFAPLQYLGVRGALPGWDARLDEPVSQEEIRRWCRILRVPAPETGVATRREGLIRCWEKLTSLESLMHSAEARKMSKQDTPARPSAAPTRERTKVTSSVAGTGNGQNG